ncbi:MAG: proteobacterial dedicated sortase system histidine kinase [Cellvibrionaceae bacterium]|nr:proteobacterial dedicated sortase system histidine kinase [Cellvibrionaceae bacterium]
MTLRKQLLLLSLITLSLPWAGLQFIQEMERTLKQGQVESLRASARVVAAYLASREDLQREIKRFNAPAETHPLYLHPLAGPPIIDGYDEEWLQYRRQIIADQQGADPFKLSATGGLYGDRIFLYLQIGDANIHYASPAMPSPTTSDHLLLQLNQNRQFYVFAPGPGRAQVMQYREDKFSPAYALQGSWIESQDGYRVELSLPRRWADKKLGIRVHNFQTGLSVGNHLAFAPAPQPLFHTAQVKKALAIFQQPGLRMAVSSPEGEILALDGSVETPSDHEQQHGFIHWFYQTVIGDDNLPNLDSPLSSGRFETPEIAAARSANVSGRELAGWYRYGDDNSVVRLAQAIGAEHGKILGLVVLDQSADSLVSMTSSAFYRMLFYSLITTSFTGLVFLAYATWLSWRIRKLSRATAAAVTDTGKIADNFPVLSNRDELGDLSRNYAHLLSRLREYTNYLRTLSSKLSHELRTPLAIVQSSLDNLEHEQLNPQAGVYAERAKLGTSRLSNILNAMSAASRVEQAISGAEMEKIPCDELLQNLKAAYEDVYGHVKFKLRIRDDEGKLQCMASGELLVQMLDKLVDNAADFCHSGGVIELGLYRHERHLVFTVFNQGPPLPKHMHGQLFDSMVSVREKSNDANDSHHLGLGLYIVRLIVDFHRGEVQGYNIADNSGVIFEVRLPV